MVPQWIVNNLGARVQTVRSFETDLHIYPPSSACTIVSIQAGQTGGCYCTCVFEDDEIECEENVPFDTLHPMHFYRR